MRLKPRAVCPGLYAVPMTLDIAAETTPEPNEEGHGVPGHDHVEFRSASLVSAMVCEGCGCYVDGNRQADHQEFHDRLGRLELAAGLKVDGDDTLF